MASGIFTGYGPSHAPFNQWQNLLFNRDDRKYEQWEVRILGYTKIKKLKDVVCAENPPAPEDNEGQDNNELAYAEICQFLDETSLSLVMRDARNDGRCALKILREHYAGRSKPRIITLYTQLTSLGKEKNESITEYILRAEKSFSALQDAGENVSDSLLVSMCLKGLPEEYKSFIAIVTQSDPPYTFQTFKQALRNYEETEKSRNWLSQKSSRTGDRILKHDDGVKIKCFKCGLEGHKAYSCPKKGKKWCKSCKSSSHSDQQCLKRDKVQKSAATEEVNVFFKVDDDLILQFNAMDTFLVDCGATTHIVNMDTNSISSDPLFQPERHYIELADGQRSNNVAKMRGTVEITIKNEQGVVSKLYLMTFFTCLLIHSVYFLSKLRQEMVLVSILMATKQHLSRKMECDFPYYNTDAYII